jgi:hypothetical protein
MPVKVRVSPWLNGSISALRDLPQITRFQNGIRLPKPMKQVGNINAKAMPKHEQYNPESE